MLDRTDETDFEEPWPDEARTGLIIQETEDGIILIAYRDHKDLARIELTLSEMARLHHALTLELWKRSGFKTRLINGIRGCCDG